MGENGAGKTTLLKLLMDRLTPTDGVRTAHRNLKFGYFSQHHVDQLDMTVSKEYIQSNPLNGSPDNGSIRLIVQDLACIIL